MLLLLLSPPRRGATLRIEAAPVLTYSTQHLIATVRVREQTRMRLHVGGVVGGYSVVVVEKEGEVLSVSAVKPRALELPKFIVHHALFEEIKIDLPIFSTVKT